jgi:hypothetical protein
MAFAHQLKPLIDLYLLKTPYLSEHPRVKAAENNNLQ